MQSQPDKRRTIPSHPFEGEVYRHVPKGLDAALPPLSSQGENRWNPQGEFEALYTAETEDGLYLELNRAAAKRGIFPADLRPRDVVILSVTLGKVVDLTDPKVLEKLSIATDDLVEESFKNTHRLARVFFREKVEGIIVPSAADKSKKNLVIFSKNLTSTSSVSERSRKEI